jgi:hypothetical protein
MIRKKIIKIYFFSLITLPFFINAQTNSDVQWSVFDNGFSTSINNNSSILSQIGEPLTGKSNNETSEVTGGFLAGIIILNSVTSINDNQNKPLSYELYQNFPNPFNPTTKIKYSIARASYVKLKIYDIIGSEVAELVNEEKPIGSYEVWLDGSKLASGVYIYRLQAGSFINTKKMILLK